MKNRKPKYIEAATAIFSTKGFNATSTTDIAKAAGSSQSLLMHHFKKRGLWELALSNASLAGTGGIFRKMVIFEILEGGERLDYIIKVYGDKLVDSIKKDVLGPDLIDKLSALVEFWAERKKDERN
ncbi:MAG TPA: TetR family transcriptional regulator [Chitinophagaceae bacterium]|nr:TetR family transcriptional regulator [Chitinophagaceae bacterium]